MRAFYISSILFLFFISMLNGEILTTGADFLKLGQGCRSMAMGNASVSLADDIEAVDANISGLAELTNMQIMLEHAEMFRDLKYESGSFAMPIGYLLRNRPDVGMLGINFIYFYMPAFSSYDLWGDVIEQVKFYGYKVTTGYAVSLYTRREIIINTGISFAFVKKNIGGSIENNFSTAIGLKGLILQRGKLRKIIGKYLKVGLLINNIGFKSSEINENTPLLLKFGVGAKIYNIVNFGVDLSKYLDSSFKFNIGAEYWYKDIVALRIGTRIGSEQLNYFTTGLGFKYRLFGQKISLDYTMLPFTDLGVTHRISLKVNIVKKKVNYANMANIYYYKGVDFFIADKYQQAIEMWNKTLDIDPNYQKAKDRIKEAEKILKFKAKEASLKNLELQMKEFEKINKKTKKE